MPTTRLPRTKSSMAKRDPVLFGTLVAIWLIFAIFIFLPIIRLLATTFVVDGSVSFANLTKIMSKSYNIRALINSLILATSVAVAGTVLGYIFALAVTRTSLPPFFKALLGAVTILPLISPPFTSSISLTLALGPNGMILNAWAFRISPYTDSLEHG